ncbi:MAG: sugar phosphate isomerase/epimerase [Clostridia bacterium]|nr:sugar phosphate isomerase/epimerase [Clostridia bacterium]
MAGGIGAVKKTVIVPGAVSATFKKLPMTADEIIALLVECGLKAVEWSENAHVQPDDPAGAAELRRKTEAVGLSVAAYGSYFRLGENELPGAAFARSLASAKALGAPLMRVWAGARGSGEVSDLQFCCLAQEAALIAEMAARQGIKVAFEWHKNTLTDTNESAWRLLREADHPNLYCLWQPTVALSPRERTAGIRMLGDRLANLHVYSWPDGKRGPLNAAEWQYYLDAAEAVGGRRCALLEFVRDDSLEQFRADARTLLNLLESGEYNG